MSGQPQLHTVQLGVDVRALPSRFHVAFEADELKGWDLFIFELPLFPLPSWVLQ